MENSNNLLDTANYHCQSEKYIFIIIMQYYNLTVLVCKQL